MWVVARSISRPVWERLHGGRFVTHALAVFERACDLVTRDGDWDALRARRSAIATRLPLLRALCLRHAPASSRPSVPVLNRVHVGWCLGRYARCGGWWQDV